MSNDGDNPFQSPSSSTVNIPWLKWHVWWASSLILLAISILWVGDVTFFGAVMVVGALAVSFRSAVVLQRKFQAGLPVSSTLQLKAVASSFFILSAALVASFIAFFVSCFSIAVVTKTPFLLVPEEVAREYAFQMRLIGSIAGIFGLTVFGLITWFSGPAKSLKAANLETVNATPPAESSDSHE